MKENVHIVEVGPRDGLQNESKFIATEDKIKLVDLLSACHFKTIETTSFVSPKWVPQMADATQVMQSIMRNKNTSYAVLAPNLQGYENASRVNVDEVAIFAAATETFSQKNINCSIAESLLRFQPVIAAAQRDNIPVRGYISCVVKCPYEGDVEPGSVASLASTLIEMGCYEISLGDTIGKAVPEQVATMLDAVMQQVDVDKLAGHFHDTKNTALDNITVSLEKGIRTFDSSIAGLGGCPYAPGAKGNVSTALAIERIHRHGYETGITSSSLHKAEKFALTLKSGHL